MFRIDDPSAAAALPTPEAAGTEGYWTEGNPGSGIAATLARASFLNMIQEELRAIVTAAGITPSKVSYNQVLTAIQTVMQRSTPMVSAAGGTADAITGTFAPAIASLTNGMTLLVRAGSANATTTPTFTPNSGVITVKTIVKLNGGALAIGDIAGSAHWLELVYDLALDKWVLLNPAGTGRLLNIQTFTASGTYTPTPGTTKVKVKVLGGGGAGGGAASTAAGNLSGGVGGGAGAYAESLITTAFAGVTVTVGAGGVGVAAAGGGAGGTSSFGALVSAPGGSSGGFLGNSAPPIYLGRSGNASVATGGSILNAEGAGGGPLTGPLTTFVTSGEGGASVFGAGAGPRGSTGAGVAAVTKGSGGSGAAALPSNPSTFAGGNGAPGIVIIEEYA